MTITRKLTKYVCQHDISLQEALSKIETNRKGFLLVLQGDVAVGVITDGDIRRLLLEGSFCTARKVIDFCNKRFVFALENEPDENVISLFSEKIKFVPILNKNGCLTDLRFSDEVDRKPRQSIIKTRAPSRITFGGGGSDKPDYFSHRNGLCITAAIKKYAFCSLSERRHGDGIRIKSSDFGCCWDFDSAEELMHSNDPRLLIYQKVFSFVDFFQDVEIQTHCDFPIGSGLGGSSSLTVAMLHAFSQLQVVDIPKILLAKNAYKLERVAMNVSGGWQDQYAAAVGGINAIFFSKAGHDVHNIRLSDTVLRELEASLYLCFSGRVHDSSEIHQSINLKNVDRLADMQETVRLAREMLTALTNEDLSNFDQNMNQNWELKKNYSEKITNDILDDDIRKFRAAGATSAKILGAGGGGYFLLRVPAENHARFHSYCYENNILAERVLFDTEGVVNW